MAWNLTSLEKYRPVRLFLLTLILSSFNAAPGLPILHSRDLVNWTIIAHALPRQPPFEVFSKPQHGNGVWAPSIRYRNGTFYIFYPDPDYGIYMINAKHPAGPWSEPLLIKAAKGWIDPCPLADSLSERRPGFRGNTNSRGKA